MTKLSYDELKKRIQGYEEDYETMLWAVKQNGSLFTFAKGKIKSDRTISLEAVKNSPFMYTKISPRFIDEDDFIMALLNNNVKHKHLLSPENLEKYKTTISELEKTPKLDPMDLFAQKLADVFSKSPHGSNTPKP